MTRRRYVQIDGVLVEVNDDYRGQAQSQKTACDSVLWGDEQYQNLGDVRFRSRSAHRQYLRDHEATTADDYAGEWARAAKARQEHFQRAPDASRAGDIARALDAVTRGHRPRRFPENEF